MSPLGNWKVGQKGTIISIGKPNGQGHVQSSPVLKRLMELGLIEGEHVEVVHRAPFGGDPLAVRVRGTLIALNRKEANLVTAEELV